MMERALEFLVCLGALDMENGKLTNPLGMRMSEVPIDPMMSKIVSFTFYTGIFFWWKED
jgi:ATP-dependent RNA helicase DDX35